MTFAEFYFAVKGKLRAEGRSNDEDDNEITEEEFLAVLAEEMEAGRA